MTGPVLPWVASNDPRRADIVHYLHDERALCGRPGIPQDWPDGECGSTLPRVTEPDPLGICPECRDARRDGHNAPGCAPRWYPWRDDFGKIHPEIPRCAGGPRPRGFGRSRGVGDCSRKGVVQRGLYAGREAWYCLQHDPARRDERRVAELAPIFLGLLREALDLVPRTKRSADWLRRAERALAKADDRGG